MRHPALPFVALAAAALLAAACGGDDDAGRPSESSAATAITTADSDAAFPVSIEHKYGSTTIDAEPARVVSVGFNDQDALLALGVIPVGIRDWYGEQPFGTWPWAQDELGGAEPELLSPNGVELNVEAVAALDPDLIVGIYSGMTQSEYDLLSAIAPTIAQPSEFVDYGTPWQEQTRIVGRAVGKVQLAEDLVTSIEDRYASICASTPSSSAPRARSRSRSTGRPAPTPRPTSAAACSSISGSSSLLRSTRSPATASSCRSAPRSWSCSTSTPSCGSSAMTLPSTPSWTSHCGSRWRSRPRVAKCSPTSSCRVRSRSRAR